MIRNIYAFEDEVGAWKHALSNFANHVPRFGTKDEATAFAKLHCRVGSNPDYPELQQSVTTLVDWSQVQRMLITKAGHYALKWARKGADEVNVSWNRFIPSEDGDSLQECDAKRFLLYRYIVSRLNLSIHVRLSQDSWMNTLRYLFNHMKCGIFVMIRDNQIVMFVPFVNKDYNNSWGNKLKLDALGGTLDNYQQEKSQYYRYDPENYLPISQWWANGNIICNAYTSGTGEITNQFWSDHFLLPIKDMFAELCRCREVPDCEFFINKRDYPQLKFNENPPFGGGPQPVEPYGFIFDRDDRQADLDLPLARERYHSYAPVLSFYSSSRFADIPIPPTEDWEAATGEVFPGSFVHSINAQGEPEVSTPRDFFTSENLRKFARPWHDKQPIAFFRGGATGGGTTVETNQRLHLAQLSYDWERDNLRKGMLDAKITGWNKRDKKIASSPVTYIHTKDFDFSGDKKKNFVPIYQQAEYKYILYVEGHCAACRYAFMMNLGSVILKVESQCVADQMWYFPMLVPYEDYVPVKADLSDLEEVLRWCQTHDEECERIAGNARQLYEQFISKEGILDYLQCITVEIARRWHDVSYAANDNVPPTQHFDANPLPLRRRHLSCTKDGQMCGYCREKELFLAEQQRQAAQAVQARSQQIMSDQNEQQGGLSRLNKRDIMLKRRAEKQQSEGQQKPGESTVKRVRTDTDEGDS